MDSPADWRQVVPSPGLPAGLEVRRANNNLDAVAHGDRLYLAFRTAPTHFASAAALVHVVASSDAGLTWAHETTLRRGRDLREPRLVVWRDRLLLYCFEGASSPRSGGRTGPGPRPGPSPRKASSCGGCGSSTAAS